MTSGTPADAREYLLFVREGRVRFVFRNSDEGIWISDQGIGWFVGGAARTRAWSELVRVHLAITFVPKHGSAGNCALHFSDGAQLNVVTGTRWGNIDEERNQRYGRFLDDLHRAIPAERRKTIVFGAGSTSGRQLGLKITLAIAFAFFVLMPLALTIIFREFKALLITLAGAGFVWPLWSAMEANKPRNYDPGHVPPELYP